MQFPVPKGDGKKQLAITQLQVYKSWPNVSPINTIPFLGNNTYEIIWPGETVIAQPFIVQLNRSFLTIQQLAQSIQVLLPTKRLVPGGRGGLNHYYILMSVNQGAYAVELDVLPLPASLPAGWSYGLKQSDGSAATWTTSPTHTRSLCCPRNTVSQT